MDAALAKPLGILLGSMLLVVVGAVSENQLGSRPTETAAGEYSARVWEKRIQCEELLDEERARRRICEAELWECRNPR